MTKSEINLKKDGFFNIFPDPVLLFKQESGNSIILTQVNQSALKTFGENVHSHIGKNIDSLKDFFPKMVWCVKNTMTTGERCQDKLTWNGYLKNSSIFPFKNSNGFTSKVHFLTDYIKLDNQSLLLVAKDVTELEEAHQELQEYADLNLGLMAEYSPLGMIYLGTDGKIKYTNPSSINQMGFLEEQVTNLVGKSFLDLPNVKKYPELSKGIKKILEEGEPLVGLEIPNLMKGEKNTFLAFGTPRFGSNNSITGAIFMYLDKSKLEEMEEILKEREEYDYELIAEYSPLGIINLNLDGEITFANPTSTQLLGWQNEKVTLVEGKNIFDFPFISQNSNLMGDIHALLEGDPLVSVEFPISIENQERVLRAYGSPRYAPNGALTGAILMYADITDLKNSEELLKRQKEELSEFAHIISHDLRNSITSILGYATLAQELDDLTHLDKVIKHARRMEFILNRSLELAEAGLVIDKKEIVDLNNLVDRITELTIPQRIIVIKKNLEPIACDQEKLSQIFQNLFRNAVIHGKPNKIEIEMTESNGEDFTGKIIIVSNDGKQIPEELHQKIFTRGFSTREEGKGMGLYIVKKLVEAHGWKIELEVSEQTTFKLLIPN
ncbi:MAG: ATP-binding protein [Candidatus Hodarchaeota archaeon]